MKEILIYGTMLALKDYGSSDEGSETENVDFASTVSGDKFTTNVQICSAPEVIPTVSIYVRSLRF